MKLAFVQQLDYSQDARDLHKSLGGHKSGEFLYYGSAVLLSYGDFLERMR